jgi:hypothetical protein
MYYYLETIYGKWRLKAQSEQEAFLEAKEFLRTSQLKPDKIYTVYKRLDDLEIGTVKHEFSERL